MSVARATHAVGVPSTWAIACTSATIKASPSGCMVRMAIVVLPHAEEPGARDALVAGLECSR